MSADLEVDSKDVIKLLMQFCEENGLGKTYEALQEESGVTLNTVESVDGFQADIKNGRWDTVLKAVSSMVLPSEKLCDLYEQILVEMAEVGEMDVARQILRETDVLRHMSETQHERHARLENLCNKTFFEIRDAYPNGANKEKRRAYLATQLSTEITVAPKSRLLTLLSHALKYQRQAGTLPDTARYDLFRGIVHVHSEIHETHPTAEARSIKFSANVTPECAAFSPDGFFFGTGSLDGFIEIWDIETGKLRTDLSYQKAGKLMMHDTCVLCLNFSADGNMLLSGCQNGVIRVWKVSTGVCLRKFERAHSKGVTSVKFTRDGSQVLSTSFDGTAKVHGLKSGKVGMKEFRGHTSYVNSAYQNESSTYLYTSSADGTVRIWDFRSLSLLSTISPPSSHSLSDPPAYFDVISIPHTEFVLLCSRNPFIEIFDTTIGKVVKTIRSGKSSGGDFVAVAVSPKGYDEGGKKKIPP